MKKSIWKRALAAIMMLGVLFSLCSCMYLDDLKARHATWANSEKTLVQFQGKTYRKLPAGKECAPILINKTMNTADFKRGNLTEADVPVLLSEETGTPFIFNDEKTLLQLQDVYYGALLFSSKSTFPELEECYYAEESVYGAYEAALAGMLDRVVYFYTAWDGEQFATYEKYLKIDAAARDTLLQALAQPAISEGLYFIEREHGTFNACDANYLVTGNILCRFATVQIGEKSVLAVISGMDESVHLLDERLGAQILAQTTDEFDYEKTYIEEVVDFPEKI